LKETETSHSLEDVPLAKEGRIWKKNMTESLYILAEVP
jgi:hypothetical protein